ncbi:hypothetical protein GCM10009092_44040 [Bowmanella denitrificans]|uniref:Tail specific protease domain-containing protein n=1 Tax=Bowmanella denitrificans TaxID=366582 RepID=A0ABN0XWM1_9ALTE
MKAIVMLLCMPLLLSGCSGAHLDIFPKLDNPALMHAKIAPELLRQDLDAFVAGVRERHPDFSGYADEAALSQMLEKLKNSITKPMTRVEFFRYVGQLSHAFGDGHSFLIWPYQELNALKEQGETPFPFAVKLTSSGVFVPQSYVSGEQQLPVGSQILRINGVATSDIFANAQRYVGGETAGLRGAFVAERFSHLLWAVYGFISQFDIELLYQGQMQTLHIDSRQSWQRAASLFERPGDDLAYQRLAGNVGYLKVDSFDVDPEEFSDQLETIFSQIVQQRPSALIIDIRNNTGGNTDTATELARYIANKPFRLVSSMTEKLNKDNRGLFGYKGQPGEMQTKALHDYVEPMGKHKGFNGDVVVLIGPVTYSAAIVFATTVQDNGFGLLAGQPTGGFANQSAQGNLFNLPHSQLRAYVATRLLVRPNGNADVTAVIPDLVVDEAFEDLHSAVDTLLQRVLQRFKNRDGT